MRHVAQAPSHYEVELRQADPERAGRHGVAGDQARRAGRGHGAADVRQPGAAQAYAKRMNRQEARIVAVEHGGWRRTVDAEET